MTLIAMFNIFKKSKQSFSEPTKYDKLAAEILSCVDDNGRMSRNNEIKYIKILKELNQDTPVRIVKASILNDLNPRVEVLDLPIRITKNEKILWIFKGVTHYQVRSRMKYGGVRGGIRIKNFSTGISTSERVSVSELRAIDQGFLIVTDKTIYFKGDLHLIRVSLDKILSNEQYFDCVALYTPKLFAFDTDDNLFFNRLINRILD